MINILFLILSHPGNIFIVLFDSLLIFIFLGKLSSHLFGDFLNAFLNVEFTQVRLDSLRWQVDQVRTD